MQVLASYRPMTCEQALGLVHLELDGEIDAHEQTLLQHHLRGCASCTQSQRLFERVKTALNDTGEAQAAPAYLVAKIRRQRSSPWPLGVMALLFVGLFVGLLLGAVFWPKAQSVDRHQEQAQALHALNLPVDIASKDTQRLKHALKSVGDVQVPVIEGFDIKGARVLEAGSQAQLVYRNPLGRRLSIVVHRGKKPAHSQGVMSKGLHYVKVGPLDNQRFAALFKP